MNTPPARPLRLLMSCDTVGGVWTYAVDLADALAGHGIATSLAVLGPGPSADQRAQAEDIAGLRLLETGLPLDWTMTSVGEVLAAGKALARLARAEQADLVQLNSPSLAIGGPFDLPILGVCHSCLASWWQAVRSGPMPADFVWQTEVLQQGLMACDRLVAPSRAFAGRIAEIYGVDAPLTVHNGRRAPTIPQDLPPRERAVLTAGRLWDEGKNVETLDAAAGELNMPVRAAGPLEGPAGQRVALHNIDSLGTLGHAVLRDAMLRAGIFVSLARYEPFGLSVLEAAQAGCALVLSDIPTHRELWDGAAVFADAEDPAGVRRAIEGLDIEALGRAAMERARLYSLQDMGDKMAAIHHSLAAAATGPKVAAR